MKRRQFISFLAGATAWPLAAPAQQSGKPARLGFLGATFASGWTARTRAFHDGLRDLGYVQGVNVLIESRWADEQYAQLPALAEELVRLKVDVLLTYGTPATFAAKRATTTVPIVMMYVGDALAAGIVPSLSRPGGNITGSTYFLSELLVKRLNLLKEAMPQIARVAILVNPSNPLFRSTLPVLEAAAQALKVDLRRFEAHGPSEFSAAVSAITAWRGEAIVFQEDAVFLGNLNLIADLAARNSLPFVGSGEFADVGALIGYGVDFIDMSRRSAVFVDKILKGAKPRDVPVEQATKFEMVLNLATAVALGVKLAPSILLRADRIIE